MPKSKKLETRLGSREPENHLYMSLKSRDSRNLPHRNISTIPVHLILRLKESIPHFKVKEIQKTLDNYKVNAQKKHSDKLDEASSASFHEALLEEAIHNYSSGPYHLQVPEIRKIVIEAWLWMERERGLLVYAICVMGNHLHVLLQSGSGEELKIGPIVKTYKQFTARNANRELKRTRTPFWEKNYFDRDVRSGRFMTVMWYILNNPVKAGLVENWHEWPGNYVHPEWAKLFYE